MKLIKSLGLPVADVSIGDFEDQRVLIVERFDRKWAHDNRLLRLPQEDFCQALSVNPSRKYESDGGPGIDDILGLLQASDQSKLDQSTFLHAQIIFWLLGATDAHAKNFSIFLLPGGRFRLSPLYDIMSTQPCVDAEQIRHNKFKLAMAIGNKRHYRISSIAPRHFMENATNTGGIIEEEMNFFLKNISEIGPKKIDETCTRLPNKFPEKIAHSISKGFYQRLELIKATL